MWFVIEDVINIVKISSQPPTIPVHGTFSNHENQKKEKRLMGWVFFPSLSSAGRVLRPFSMGSLRLRISSRCNDLTGLGLVGLPRTVTPRRSCGAQEQTYVEKHPWPQPQFPRFKDCQDQSLS